MFLVIIEVLYEIGSELIEGRIFFWCPQLYSFSAHVVHRPILIAQQLIVLVLEFVSLSSQLLNFPFILFPFMLCESLLITFDLLLLLEHLFLIRVQLVEIVNNLPADEKSHQ